MARHITPQHLAALTGDKAAVAPRVIHGPAVHLRADDFDEEPTLGERIAAAALDPTGLLAVLAVVLWAILI